MRCSSFRVHTLLFMISFRIVTYNVHKCQGLDQRVRPSRIVEVLSHLDADVIALQEVLSVEDSTTEANQAEFIAKGLGLDYCVGENRKLRGGKYGNVTLSRLPFASTCNYDITRRGREPRGCLRVDLRLPDGEVLHIFNVHLGTSFLERRFQARRLIDAEILNSNRLSGARIVLGDFNEWTRGLASRLLNVHFETAEPRLHLPRARTYPGIFPVLHLDHIYFDPELKLERLTLHRTPLALVASDHLPLIADFSFKRQSKV